MRQRLLEGALIVYLCLVAGLCVAFALAARGL